MSNPTRPIAWRLRIKDAKSRGTLDAEDEAWFESARLCELFTSREITADTDSAFWDYTRDPREVGPSTDETPWVENLDGEMGYMEDLVNALYEECFLVPGELQRISSDRLVERGASWVRIEALFELWERCVSYWWQRWQEAEKDWIADSECGHPAAPGLGWIAVGGG